MYDRYMAITCACQPYSYIQGERSPKRTTFHT